MATALGAFPEDDRGHGLSPLREMGRIMKRVALVPALAAAAVIAAPAPSALASTSAHTMTLKTVTDSQVQTSKSSFLLAGTDYRNGVKVGKDVVTCKFAASHDHFNCTVALALKDGLIAADFTLVKSRFFSGSIVAGTRKYAGIHGLLSGVQTKSGALVTLTYTL
jgi:hypothetical protein